MHDMHILQYLSLNDLLNTVFVSKQFEEATQYAFKSNFKHLNARKQLNEQCLNKEQILILFRKFGHLMNSLNFETKILSEKKDDSYITTADKI